HERSDLGPGPLECIDEKHAVAVAVDDFVPDIILEIAHAADGHGHFDAFVRSRDPERRRTTARDARNRQAFRIHLGTALEVIEGANSIPTFDTGGGVTAGLPPPTILAIRAVMNRGYLAQLKGVDDQAHV